MDPEGFDRKNLQNLDRVDSWWDKIKMEVESFNTNSIRSKEAVIEAKIKRTV
jgi:hypothetical protein